ncbi:MAG: outer membrane protein transport protein [Verrucomicrobiota bacterium]
MSKTKPAIIMMNIFNRKFRLINPMPLAERLFLFVIVSGMMLCLPNRVDALGFRIPNQDAEATGRGNAFTATANNPSAIYYNPAGITQLEGLNAQVGFHIISVNSHYESATTGKKSDTEFDVLPVPQAYYTYSPKESPLSYGLGIYVPYGLGLEWPEDTGFRTLAIRGQLNYTTINPVFAYQVCPSLSIAAGPTINYARLKLKQGILAPGDSFKFDGEDTAFGFNCGILWQPFEKWSFGANYRSETTMDFEGQADVQSVVPAAVPSGSKHSVASAPFAQFAMAGISFRPSEKWNIEVGVDWTDWDSLNTVTFKHTSLGDINFPLNWESSFLYELGASRYFENGYFLSAGYFYSQNSTSERSFNPIVPDTDLHVGSLGFGYKGEHWRWALSGQIIIGPTRTVDSSKSTSLVGQSANGKYHWFNQAVNVSVGYHF